MQNTNRTKKTRRKATRPLKQKTEKEIECLREARYEKQKEHAQRFGFDHAKRCIVPGTEDKRRGNLLDSLKLKRKQAADEAAAEKEAADLEWLASRCEAAA